MTTMAVKAPAEVVAKRLAEVAANCPPAVVAKRLAEARATAGHRRERR